MNDVTICFQDAQKILCADHKKSNIETNLKELEQQHVPRNIFYLILLAKKLVLCIKGGLLIQKRQWKLTDVFETLNLHGIV